MINYPPGNGRKQAICTECHHAKAREKKDDDIINQYQLCEIDTLGFCTYPKCTDYTKCYTHVFCERGM